MTPLNIKLLTSTLLWTLAFSLWPFDLSSQDTLPPTNLIWTEYRTFIDPPEPDTSEPKSLYLKVRSTSYFKNNEYKNDFTSGYSLAGIFFEPAVQFHPDSRTTITAGVHLLKYFGRDNFDRVLPVISIRHNLSPNFSMIFGTLYGTTAHGLPEPLFDFERYLIDNYENGIQFLWNYPLFRGDVWLNWEQFIKQNDPFQEKFTAAANTSFKILDWNGLTISLPFMALFRHTGGEIDATNLPAGTQSNLILGTRGEWSFQNSFFESVWINHQWIEFLEINPGGHINIPEGQGQYSRFGLGTKAGTFEVGYWNAKDFTSPHGMPLFLSSSLKNPDFYLTDREMLTIKYEFHRPLTSFLDFAFRLEPYYHFYTNRMDHSWSIYLKLNERFFLGKLGNLRK